MGNAALPSYLKRFILRTSPSLEKSLVIHPSASIEGYKDDPDLDKAAIERRRGFFGKSQKGVHPEAIHHIKIFTNSQGTGRLYYKFEGSIQFIKNAR